MIESTAWPGLPLHALASTGLKMETTFTVFISRPRLVLFDSDIRIANGSSPWRFTDIHKEIRKFKISRVGFAPL
jgi:hypothetical protein